MTVARSSCRPTHPPPARSRPVNKNAGPAKPPPSRAGKPPSGATAAAKKSDVRAPPGKAGSKDDKGAGPNKSATSKAAKDASNKTEENKDEKIVEEEKEERRFDPSGYDKDLVEMLGTTLNCST